MPKTVKTVLIIVASVFALLVVLAVAGYFLLVSSFGPSPVPGYGTPDEAFEAAGFTTSLPTWLPDEIEPKGIYAHEGRIDIQYNNNAGSKSFHFSADKTIKTTPEPSEDDKDYELVEEHDLDGSTVTVKWHTGWERYLTYWHRDGILYEITTGYGFPLEELLLVIENVK